MNVALPTGLIVDEFLTWALRQDKGRFELFGGRVIKQAPQNWGHVETRGKAYCTLRGALSRSAIPFFVSPSGPIVRIDKTSAFEPDALVAPLPKPDQRDLEIPHPVLVVEVLSPSTTRRDLVDKLTGYFSLPSIQRYLVIDPAEREIIWHRRAAGAALEPPPTLREGSLRLDPPGIEIAVADVFPPEPAT